MNKYLMMGVQGSGKSTHSHMLAADLDIVHISMGDIFRWHVQNHTKTGAHIRRIMAAGELLGDEIVQSVIQTRLTEHDWNFGFVIDGFPRNRPQAEFFLQNYDIDGVIVLHVPDTRGPPAGAQPQAVRGLRQQLPSDGQPPRGARQVRRVRRAAGHPGG